MASALVSEHCLSPVRVIVLMILVIHNMKPMHKWLSPSWLISEPIPTRCIPMLGNLPSHREEDWELMDFELVVLQTKPKKSIQIHKTAYPPPQPRENKEEFMCGSIQKIYKVDQKCKAHYFVVYTHWIPFVKNSGLSI